MTWPMMEENITVKDIYELITFLGHEDHEAYGWDDTPPIPRLTQSNEVAAFEREFADWLGVKHAVMVNSGASANLITMAALQFEGKTEIIVPTITWVSDIAAVLHANYRPVFVDIDPRTLGMDKEQIFKKITPYTRAVFVTHVLGFNALDMETVQQLKALDIVLIEDCCEATGAFMAERNVLMKRLGTFGLASNFSFYYAHHMSTIEGGMVCTDDDDFYQRLRQWRSHGLRRERTSGIEPEPGLDPEFIFDHPGYNVRSTEINAVIGRSQLKRLDDGINLRRNNLNIWLHLLGPRYVTDYHTEGASNYALPLVLKEPDPELMAEVIACLRENGVEFRLGTAGGGNQLRQPYLRRHQWVVRDHHDNYPKAEHVHFYGLYIGNYPSLVDEKIIDLCDKLNAL